MKKLILLVALFACMVAFVTAQTDEESDLEAWCREQGQTWALGGSYYGCVVGKDASVKVTESLAIPDNETLLIDGVLINNSTITNHQLILNSGAIYNMGTISNYDRFENLGSIYQGLCSGSVIDEISPITGDGEIINLDNCRFVSFAINTDGGKNALRALFNSTNGQNWKNNFGWGVGNPCVHNWHGVTCESGNVVWIDLHGNHLNGFSPAELGGLNRLRFLYLDRNQLSGSVPTELGNLNSLERLFLFENQLSGIIPPDLGKLYSLEWLGLDSNQLSGPIPPELGKLGNLDRLDLFENQLSGAIPDALRNLTGLGELYLYGNPALNCWETKEALDWALSRTYIGPKEVCP